MESKREPIDTVLEFVTTYWLPIIGLLTITAYLSGMAYFHGYLGPFGFGYLTYSLDPITILAYGGLTAVLTIAVQALGLAGLMPLAITAGERMRRNQRLVVTIDKIGEAFRKGAPAAAGVTISIMLAIPWQWLVPDLMIAFATFGVVGLVLLVIVFVLSYAVALGGLRGKPFAIFIVALLISSAPGLTLLLGNRAADRLMHDPDSFPRVNIWWNETQATPSGYVLVHQDQDQLYLLIISTFTDPEDSKEKKLYTATTANVNDVYHVEFFGAGTEIKVVQRERRSS